MSLAVVAASASFCNYFLQSKLHVRETSLPGSGRYHKSVYGVLFFSFFFWAGDREGRFKQGLTR